MTHDEKIAFISSLCDSVKAGMIHDLDKTPEDWEGVELRHWIVDRFKYRVICGTYDRKRLRDYRNDVLVNNLD